MEYALAAMLRGYHQQNLWNAEWVLMKFSYQFVGSRRMVFENNINKFLTKENINKGKVLSY